LATPGLFGVDRAVVVATHHLPDDHPYRQLALPHAGVSTAGPAR
jgi:ATP-binding cassette subfamily C protein CydC